MIIIALSCPFIHLSLCMPTLIHSALAECMGEVLLQAPHKEDDAGKRGGAGGGLAVGVKAGLLALKREVVR